jgi:choline dehydrogenase
MVEAVRLCWRATMTPEVMAFAEQVPMLTEEIVASDEALAGMLRASVATAMHTAGTARMGPANDTMAVVDQYCRVRGVERLRVVDASVMPTIPRANTNLTCIMIGEQVAGWMRQER